MRRPPANSELPADFVIRDFDVSTDDSENVFDRSSGAVAKERANPNVAGLS